MEIPLQTSNRPGPGTPASAAAGGGGGVQRPWWPMVNGIEWGYYGLMEYDDWLVVSNMLFPFHIWDVILPIDQYISRLLKPSTR